MSWFNDVTGTSDYERQSWRDSYNGGRAAGDITGNVNAQLERERDAFQGATWSGSSTQPSGIQLAQQIQYWERGYVPPASTGPAATVVGVSATTGPGVAGALTSVTGSETKGPGASGVAAGPVAGVGGTGAVGGGPRRDGTGIQLPMDKASPLMPIYAGGRQLALDRGWSNAADVEDRLGEGEFLSPTWFYNWGIAGADTWANLSSSNGGPLKTRKIQEDLYEAPGVAGDWLQRMGNGFLETRKAMRDPYGPDYPTPGFTTGGF